MTTGAFLVLVVAVLVGATVQTSVGLGLGLVAAPVATLLEPDLMPGLVIALALVLPAVTLLGEHEGIDWGGLGWALPPRLVGTAAGVWVVGRVGERVLGLGVGVLVLVAVGLTATRLRIPVTRWTLVTAGLVSGFTGTTTSVGGPPVALLYQHRPAAIVRTTLAAYFLLGAATSLVALALGGELAGRQVRLAGLLVPAILLGALVGTRVRGRLPPHALRPAVLALSAAAALLLLVRSAVG